MIELLEGLHETVNFENESLIKFYDNTDCESYPLHWHNSIEIIMPIDNPYTVVSNQVAYHLRVGDILVIQPDVLHSMPAMPGRRFICQASLQPIYTLKMYKSMCSLLPPSLLIIPEQNEALRSGISKQLYSIFNAYNTIHHTSELSMYIAILQILMQISNAASEDAAGRSDQEHLNHSYNFQAICDYISNHFAERLTLEEIAKKSGYSKFHFERLFKKYTNESFYQYLNKIRIRHAAYLLTNHDISVTDAAYKSGFTTISSFIRMFKIHLKCTPSEYRSVRIAVREKKANEIM